MVRKGWFFFLQVCPGLSSRLTFSKTKINGKSFWSGHDFARKIKQNNSLLFMSACLGIKTFKSSKQTTQTGRVKFTSLVMSSRKNQSTFQSTACSSNLDWFLWADVTRNGILLPKLFWPTVRKNVLVFEKNFCNSKLKAENLQNFEITALFCEVTINFIGKCCVFFYTRICI